MIAVYSHLLPISLHYLRIKTSTNALSYSFEKVCSKGFSPFKFRRIRELKPLLRTLTNAKEYYFPVTVSTNSSAFSTKAGLRFSSL